MASSLAQPPSCRVPCPWSPHSPARHLQAGPGGFPAFCGVQPSSGVCDTTRPPPTWPLGVGFRKHGSERAAGACGGPGSSCGSGASSTSAPAPGRSRSGGPKRGGDWRCRSRSAAALGGGGRAEHTAGCSQGLCYRIAFAFAPRQAPTRLARRKRASEPGRLAELGLSPAGAGSSERGSSVRSAFSCSCPKSQHNVPKPSPDLHPLPPFHQEAPLGQVCRPGWCQEGFVVSKCLDILEA